MARGQPIVLSPCERKQRLLMKLQYTFGCGWIDCPGHDEAVEHAVGYRVMKPDGTIWLGPIYGVFDTHEEGLHQLHCARIVYAGSSGMEKARN